ncbi:tetratricopeptide repeat protein [Granulicella pectinivorans]|nr:hypothetical protein [Granulicella pectinivorans]
MKSMVGLRVVRILILSLAGAGVATGQSSQPISLVQPAGTGRVVYRSDPAWKIRGLGLLDEGTRPVLELANQEQKMSLSYLMFVNDTGKHDSESCRKAVVGPILTRLGEIAAVKNSRAGTYTTKSGKVLATHSYLLSGYGEMKMEQQNLFGFFGDASTCFEVHVSKVSYEPGDQAMMEAELDRFAFDAGYQPTTMDYFQQAEILFRALQKPGAAAFYYRAALDSVPVEGMDARQVMQRRVLTDQLVMSYGMTEQFKKSRELATQAIQLDPEYPLNYYNLACADAEQGHAADARAHLQQAFDRKANVLPGEKMPDPARDSSFQKLKKDAAFWTFVQGFSTPMELRKR